MFTHAQRLERARLSLEGLSVGDAFGETFFREPTTLPDELANRVLRPAPWKWTDDTAMACALVDALEAERTIDPDALMQRLARRYDMDPHRGYGAGAHMLLDNVAAGDPWRAASRDLFNGEGSLGNGAAMRVAPLGAYFADDLDALVREARLSAEVTHAHAEGQAGAIAVALGAAFAWLHKHDPGGHPASQLLEFVHTRTPPGAVRDGVATARALPSGASVALAGGALGVGWGVRADDTVPFVLWCASRGLDDFEETLWLTVNGLGDRDTTCAMVGGIVALSTGIEAIPAAWLRAREALQMRI